MATRPQAPPALHRVILCIDIAGFAAPHRTDADQIAVRDAFYRALRSAFAGGGLVWEDCYLEDRGDGALVLVPPAVPTHLLLAAVPNELAAVLREHNRNHRPEARIRLRLSIHAGEVQHDSHGMVGQSINLAFRLLDSPSLKRALARSSGELALIMSESVYRGVIRQDPAFNPAAYQPVTIVANEAEAPAWIRVFPDPHLPAQGTAGHDPRQASIHVDRPGGPGADDFDEFYLSNCRLVRNVINARAQDWTLAEEVTDEAMAIAYRKWDELREHPNPVGFVIVTARRILSRTQRQRARKNPPGHPLSLDAPLGLELKATAAGPEDIAVHRTALKQALRGLPTDQRECFVLHEILGHPVRQIAEALNLPEGTVKTRLRAARQALRYQLGDNLGEEGNR